MGPELRLPQPLRLGVESGQGGAGMEAGRMAGLLRSSRERRGKEAGGGPGMSQGLAKAAVLLGLMFLRGCQITYQYIIQ